MGISGIGNQAQPLQNQPSISEAKAESMHDAMKAATETLDAEVTMLSKEMLGKTDKSRDSSKQQQVNQARDGATPEEIAAQAASQMTEEDQKVKKKKDKKKKERSEKKMEGLMQQMSGLEEQVDVKKLDQETKGVFEKFFGTMKKIRDLRRELKSLDMEEEEAEKLLSSQ